jgi:hypothetical protein
MHQLLYLQEGKGALYTRDYSTRGFAEKGPSTVALGPAPCQALDAALELELL